MFPSQSRELLKRANFEEYLKDTWVLPKNTIYPLKLWGEGAL